MRHSIITLLICTAVLLSSVQGQNSFTLRLDETNTLQAILDILTTSRAMNYGEWHPNPTAGDPNYFIYISSGSVNLNGADQSITLSLNGTAYAEFSMGFFPFSFSKEKDISIEVSGIPTLVTDPATGQADIALTVTSVNLTVEDVWPNWLPGSSDLSVTLEDHYDGLVFINLLELYPDLDPYYFNNPELIVTDDALLISVHLNQELVLANKSTSNPDGYLPGNLSLENLDTPELTQLNKPSPSSVLARMNDRYIATTHERVIGNEVHLTWTNNVDHKLTTDPFPLSQEFFEEGVIAWYKVQEAVNISSNRQVELQFKDPWYYDETTHSQPDDFRPISPGQYQVFLNQNPQFRDEYPIYRLKAPYVVATQSDIYVFDHWESSGSDDAVFDAQGATTTTNRETPVVFKNPGARVMAKYVNALTEGRIVEIGVQQRP